MEALAWRGGSLGGNITAAARTRVRARSVIVSDELVDGVRRGEGEGGEAECLAEEETETGGTVDVEFGLGRGACAREARS